MQVIIPMSGTGDRFVRAGYAVPKPLIEVDGKPMIEHVVRMFPGESGFTFICNSAHLAATDMREVLERVAPGCRIVEMEAAKLGPVHAVLQAEKFIRDAEPAIVNYCDFSVLWDYGDFKRKMEETRCDGCITAYRGFHPHSLGSTYYAYAKVDEANRLLEIREKESFTSNRMQEYASAGTYYFSRGAHVKKYFRELLDRKIGKNGEYYVSLAYNLMNRDGFRTLVFELEKFLQWGTPEDLEEYKWWSGAFAMKAKKQELGLGKASQELQLVMPMAGAGSRFSKEGYLLPKPLVAVSGRPMFVQALSDAPEHRSSVLIVQKPLEERIQREADALLLKPKVITVDSLTDGQASTAMVARKHLLPEKPLFIVPCDTGFIWSAQDFAGIANDPEVDCCVWAFTNYAPSARSPNSYGWILAGQSGKVQKVSCKVPLSGRPLGDLGVTGAFYFRKAQFFFEAVESMVAKGRRVNGEYYIDECINELVEGGRKVAAFKAEKYLCWGSPNELKTYEYWQDYFDRNPEHPYKKALDEDFP